MTFLGLPLAQLALMVGITAGLITVLYILKLRRRRVTVPFAPLWDRVRQERESTSLFRRLKRLLSLLLQLFLVALLAAALADPRLDQGLLQGRHLILLLDASGSMQATDGGPTEEGARGSRTRLQAALEHARAVVRGMGGADRMMIVRMAAHATPLSPFTGDQKALMRALEEVQAADTAADLPRALQFCADALGERENPRLILISDGAFPAAQLAQVGMIYAAAAMPAPAPKEGPRLDRVDLTGLEVRYQPVGSAAADNVGIVAFNARRYPRNKLSFELFLEVINQRETPARVDLALYSDGRLIEVQRLGLAPGKRSRFICDPAAPAGRQAAWCKLAAAGELLEARLLAPGGSGTARKLDNFSLDDRAWSLLPRRERQRVMLVTAGNLYLEGALLLEEGLEVIRVKPEAYSAAAAAKVDAIIFDRTFPDEAPPVSYLAVAPPKDKAPLPLGTAVKAPLVTEQDRAHPVMRWVTLKDVNISESLTMARGPGVQVLAASFRAPIIVARQQGSVRSVVMGFDLTRSDLPIRVAFPLLVMNSLDWFSGEGEDLVTSFRAGTRFSVPVARLDSDSSATVATLTTPSRRTLQVPREGARVAFTGQRVGLYTLRYGQGTMRLAANLADASESDTRARKDLALGGKKLLPPDAPEGGARRRIWPYLLLAVFALLMLEWWTYNRRVTV